MSALPQHRPVAAPLPPANTHTVKARTSLQPLALRMSPAAPGPLPAPFPSSLQCSYTGAPLQFPRAPNISLASGPLHMLFPHLRQLPF